MPERCLYFNGNTLYFEKLLRFSENATYFEQFGSYLLKHRGERKSENHGCNKCFEKIVMQLRKLIVKNIILSTLSSSLGYSWLEF